MLRLKQLSLALGSETRDGRRFAPLGLRKGFLLLGILLIVIILGVTSFPVKKAYPSNAASWYDYTWKYRKAITIDHTKIANTDQSDFPILIKITDTDLKNHAQSSGYDILFTDSTGTTKIPYEREQYLSSTGTLVAWVKISTLSHTDDTIIYMYYGNSIASDQQQATSVWDSNFKGVWHSNDASSTTITDSTINANTGTKYGATGPTETTGKIGEAQSYNGSDDYVRSNPSGILSGSYTISAWAKVLDSNGDHTVFGTRNDGDYTFDFKFDTGDDGNNIHGDVGDGSDWITNHANVDPSTFSYSTDTWYQITYVVTPTRYTIYVDGNNVAGESCDVSDISCDYNPLLYNSTHNIFIGQVGYDDEWFKGAIDEVRVSDIARSADWIQTEYNNQNDPSSFYSLGDETIGDNAPPTVPGVPQATIGTNLTSQDWSWTDSTDSKSGLSHYHWQVDGGPSGTTTTPNVTTNLGVGNWKFHVKAEDYAGNQSAAQSALLSILSASISQVTIDNSIPIAWIITPDGVSDPNIDLSPVTVLNGDLFEANLNTELHLKTLLPSATVIVDIPAGAVIKGSSSTWTKAIIPPVTTSIVAIPAPSGFTAQVALAILIGNSSTPLDITKGVRIFMEGQARKKVGYVSNDVFTEITDACNNDFQAVGDNLVAGGTCKIDSGSDLVIWTKHFSKFATYDLILASTSTSSNNSSGNSAQAPDCGNSVTNGAPDLFEIRVNNRTAALYFAPPPAPYNSFYVSYSQKPNIWQYGVSFDQNNSTGVLKYTINKLAPNTKYYFRIRAGNGCATGGWGDTMAAQTTSSSSQNKTFYKNVFAAVWQNVQQVINKWLPTPPVNPSPAPKPKPDKITSTVGTQTSKSTPVKPKFCLLWWCF